jgi:SAM-dependent methyltransferase
MSTEYGDSCAEYYDELYGFANRSVVRALRGLARGGTALELGLATGRTAIALAEHCAAVYGIESSSAMLERFSAKDGSTRVRAIHGDFAAVVLEQRFDLVFALVDTFFLLTTEAAQSGCMRNIVRMLKPNGVLVLESFPKFGRREQEAVVERHFVTTSGGQREYVVRRYQRTNEELDTMASTAGLELAERWSDWGGSTCTVDSTQSISVYRLRRETPPN